MRLVCKRIPHAVGLHGFFLYDIAMQRCKQEEQDLSGFPYQNWLTFVSGWFNEYHYGETHDQLCLHCQISIVK